MTDLIGRIVAGILRQEGEALDSLNPGNLKLCPWIQNPVIEKGFWKPSSRAQGIAGIYHVIALHIAKGETLTQIINSYSPPSDHNPTSQYIENVRKWAGLPKLDSSQAEPPLWTYLEQPPIGV